MLKFNQVLGDKEIRRALRSFLSSEHCEDRGKQGALIVEELGFCRGQARIDLVVVSAGLHGYEIKSERDTLRRLKTQVEIYSRVLEHASLVTCERHLDEAFDLLPSWWGLIQIDQNSSGPEFTEIRQCSRNPELHARSLVELLWRDEALFLLAQRNADHGVRSKPRFAVWDRLCEHFSLDEIAAEVRKCLRARLTPGDPLLSG